jgi:hypothetical protein
MPASSQDMMDLLLQDLRAFALPGSELIVDKSGNLDFQCRTRHVTARFMFENDKFPPDVCHRNERTSYRTFLASEDLADLKLIAKQTLAVIPDLPSYIPTLGLASEEDSNNEPVPCEALLLRFSAEEAEGATNLTFVRAAAGAGKTECVRMLARSQAKRYLRGEVDWLFFYIDAQGKSLSSLTDVFAAQIHKYGIFSIRNDSIAALTRNRLIVPIIDGFDELVGSGGHAESFGALAVFLAQLYGSGSLIATGRSTYYENQKLRTAATRFNHNGTINYAFRSISTLPWSDEQIVSYSEKTGASLEAKAQVGALFSSVVATSSLRSPFFVAKALILVDGNSLSPKLLHSADLLLDELVELLLEREVVKLAHENGDPILPLEGHQFMLRQCAREAWMLESGVLDFDTLCIISEMTASEYNLNPRTQGILERRLPTHAFFMTAETGAADPARRSVRFEHGLYFEYFLADVFVLMVRSQDPAIAEMLRHSLLSPDFSPQFSGRRHGWSAESGKAAVQFILSSMSTHSFGGESARKNGGVLVSSLLLALPENLEGLKVGGVEFMQIDFSDSKFSGVTFTECTFYFCVLAGARWHECAFKACYWEMVSIDMMTQMNGCSFEPVEYLHSIRINDDDVYSPDLIRKHMLSLGFSGLPALAPTAPTTWSERQLHIAELLRKLCKRMERSFQIDIYDTDSVQPGMRRIMEDIEWGTLRSLLLEASLLEARHAQRKGQDQRLWRLAATAGEILAGEAQGGSSDVRVVDFWSALRSLT